MVQKKSKHGLNTGNTLRSAALSKIAHKSTYKLFTNHLERVQVEIDSEFERFLHNKLDIESIAYIKWQLDLMKAKRKQNASRKKTKRMAILQQNTGIPTEHFNPANFEYVKIKTEIQLNNMHEFDVESIPHATYLIRLNNMLKTLSYLPNDGTEISLDKHGYWQIIEHFETLDIPAVRCCRQTGKTDILPLQPVYRSSLKGKTINLWHAGCQKIDHPDLLAKRSLVYDNQHIRGIQRKQHLGRKAMREQKMSSSKRKNFCLRNLLSAVENMGACSDHFLERECHFTRDTPFVYMNVSRGSAHLSKQLANYKSLQERRFKKKCKDSTVTHYGAQHGNICGIRGVHIVNKEQFEAMKATENIKEPSQYTTTYYNSFGTTHPWTKQMSLDELEPQKLKNNAGVQCHGNQEPSDSFHGHRPLRSKDPGSKSKCDQTDVIKSSGISWNRQTARRSLKGQAQEHFQDDLQPTKDRKVQGILQGKKDFEALFLTEGLREMDMHDRNQEGIPRRLVHSEIVESHLPIMAREIMRKELQNRNVCGEIEPSSQNKRCHRNTRDVIQPKEDKHLPKDVGRSNVIGNDVQKERIEVSLWSVINCCSDRNNDAPSHNIQFTHCNNGLCCLHQDDITRNGFVPIKPPGTRTERFRTHLRKDSLDVPTKSEDKSSDSRKKPKKKRTKKVTLRSVLEDPANDVDVLLCRGFLVNIKPNSLQRQRLERKYGDNYEEGRASPRKFWINASDMVTETKNLEESKTADTLSNSNLSFMSTCAVLIVEETKIKRQLTKTECIPGENSLPHQSVIVQLKCDFQGEGKRELYDRVRSKIKDQLVYSLSKLVQYFVEIYKGMILEGFGCDKIPMWVASDPSSSIRQCDWLQTLCSWRYVIHSAYDTYNMFKTNLQMNHLSSKVKSSSVSRPYPDLLSPDRVLPNHGNDANPDQQTAQSRNKNEMFCYCLCKRCYKTIINEGNLLAAKQHPDTPYKIYEMAGNRWTMRYSSSVCDHSVCEDCLHQHVVDQMKTDECIKISCPVSDCDVVLDPVVVLSVVSLIRYRGFLRQKLNAVVASHPLWQWCPGRRCHNAVKVGGSALLDACIVIECACHHIWCFSCRKEAHWPANCAAAATYRQRKQSVISNGALHEYIMAKLLCNSCMNNELMHNAKHQKQQHNFARPSTEPDSEDQRFFQNNCRCALLFCDQCLNLPDFSIHIPKRVLKAKAASVVNCSDTLLPVLLFHQAIRHHINKEKWIPVRAEATATNLARRISNYRNRRNLQTPSPVIPRLGPAAIRPHVLPSAGTEKLFLILAFQFLYQAHSFLEYVCVSLMEMDSVTMATKSAIVENAANLNDNINALDKIISEILHNPRTNMLKAKSLMNLGRVLLSELAIKIHNKNKHA